MPRRLITPEDLENANAGLATIPFYPALPEAQAEIQVDIGLMCGNAEVLEWLVKQAKRQWTKWQGLAGLRAILEQRHVAADENAATGEARYLELEAVRTDAKLRQWRQEAKALGGAQQRQIAGVVEMPAPKPTVAKSATTQPEPEPAAKRTVEENQCLIAKLKADLAKRGSVPAVEIGPDGKATWAGRRA